MSWLEEMLGVTRPVIAMAHLPPLPGAPHYDAGGGMAAIIDYVGRDLEALQAGGVDAVMFGNEGDRPYLLEASPESLAAMAAVVGALRGEVGVPFGVNYLWDPVATVALAVATGAAFAREVFHRRLRLRHGPVAAQRGEGGAAQMTHLLGLDIGTTSTIGILVDAEGGTRATTSRPSELVSRHPNWAEEDPSRWWSNICAIIPELLASADARASDIAALGVTGMVPTTILLDEEGRPLRDSIQQNDARAVQEIEDVKQAVDPDEFFARTGGSINQQSLAPKLRWLTADVLEQPIQRLLRHPGSCLGAAFVAGVGTGAIDDWSAIGRYVRPDCVFDPESARLPAYREGYDVYRDLYRRLQSLYPRLSALPAE